jgi:hypothetical protein
VGFMPHPHVAGVGGHISTFPTLTNHSQTQYQSYSMPAGAGAGAGLDFGGLMVLGHGKKWVVQPNMP